MSDNFLYHLGDAVDWAAVRQALCGLELDESAEARQRAAADYHWYSPILAEQLRGKRPGSGGAATHVRRCAATGRSLRPPPCAAHRARRRHGQLRPMRAAAWRHRHGRHRAEPDAAHGAGLGQRRSRRVAARPEPGRHATPASSCACGPAPSASPRSAASSPAGIRASAPSATASWPTPAMCCGCASSRWKTRRRCSTCSTPTSRRYTTPTAATASSPRSRWR